MSWTVVVFVGPHGALKAVWRRLEDTEPAEVMVAEVGRHVGLLIAEVADGGG